MTHAEAVRMAIKAVDDFYFNRPTLRDEIGAALQSMLAAKTVVNIEIYDEEEIHENCTVQVWRNSHTGATSIGWWKNGTDN